MYAVPDYLIDNLQLSEGSVEKKAAITKSIIRALVMTREREVETGDS